MQADNLTFVLGFHRIDQPGIETINKSSHIGIKPFLGLQVSEATLSFMISVLEVIHQQKQKQTKKELRFCFWFSLVCVMYFS